MKNRWTVLLCSFMLLLAACEKFTEPLSFAPSFNLNEASDISRLTANLSGTITLNGGKIVKYGFTYGEFQNLANAENVDFSGSPSGSITANLTGLKPNTIYYYRLYASSGASTVNSEVKSFRTADSGAPSFTPVTELGKNEQSITVRCQLTDDGGYSVISMGIAYRRSDTQKYVTVMLDEPTTEEYVLTIDGLEAGTTYMVCGYGIGQGGIGYGKELAITTEDSEAPVVNTGTITEFGGSWIVATAQQLSPGFSDVVERGFCYSDANQVPTLTDGHVTAPGTANEVFTQKITGLKGSTLYYVRAYARNGTKVGYGKVETVTTKELTAPTLGEVTTESLTYHSLDMRASVTGLGNGIVQAYGFCYSDTQQNPTLENATVQNGTGLSDTGGQFTALLDGLSSGTTYYITAFATNEAGTTYSSVRTATTVTTSVPTVSAVSVSGVTARTATLASGVTDNGNRDIEEYGFCWTTNGDEPTVENCTGKMSFTTGDGHSMTHQLTNLLPDTSYKVRAYAINAVGAGYGAVATFKTEIDPTPGEGDNESPEL